MPGGAERVIYVDGFAKSLMPGLRMRHGPDAVNLTRGLPRREVSILHGV